MFGMQEMVLILLIALIVLGPRKLPELGKSLGSAMAQFRRASEDFKRTWEQEVESEKHKNEPTSSDSNYSYNESYDPYNSYSEESNNNAASDTAPESSSETSTENKIENDVATVGAQTAILQPQPEKKHWI